MYFPLLHVDNDESPVAVINVNWKENLIKIKHSNFSGPPKEKSICY